MALNLATLLEGAALLSLVALRRPGDAP